MKKLLVFIFILFFVNLFNQIARSQEVSKPGKIKVEGNVVAIDALAPMEGLTFGMQQEIFIFRIEKLIQGNEDSRYIKVKYVYYSNASPLVSGLLKGGVNKWKIKLERDQNCDSNLEEMSFSKSYVVENINKEMLEKMVEKMADGSDASVDGVKEGPKILRLKDTGGLADVPKSRKIPCYILKPESIKSLGDN